jgi:hypothetical protein
MKKGGKQLTEQEKLSIILRYQRIKDRVSDETVGDLAAEFGIDRDYPRKLFLQKSKPGASLKVQRRSGRPTIRTPAFKAKLSKNSRKTQFFFSLPSATFSVFRLDGGQGTKSAEVFRFQDKTQANAEHQAHEEPGVICKETR